VSVNPNAVSVGTQLDEDLKLARNGMGQPLHDITKVDIRLLIEKPEKARWEKCATIVLGVVRSDKLTIWKAVCAIDRTFPESVPKDDAGNRVWPRIPDSDTIRKAIHWATHEAKETGGARQVGTVIAAAAEPAAPAAPKAPAPASTPSAAPTSGGAAAPTDASKTVNSQDDPGSLTYSPSLAQAATNADPWADIELEPARKRELQKWLSMFRAQHPASPRGLLLFGPPGTGKTLLARTLAKASGAQFIAATISDLKAPNVGGTAQRVRDLWTNARNAAKSIIFVDECEGIFGARESVENDSFNRELLQEFLAQWEGVLDNSRHVWVIGATNRRERVDHAMVSRFGAEFQFNLPDTDLREKILVRELVRCQVQPGEEVHEIVAMTNGFSGRDIRTLAEAVARDSYDDVTETCAPTMDDYVRHVEAIRKRGNIGVTKRSTWANLILADETKNQLKIMCEMLRRSDEMRAHNIELPRGVLLYGPSGTGKTEIARTLANESGLNFVGAKSTDFVGGFTGWSGQMTKSIFLRARAESPAILFIDELDKIAPRPEFQGSSQGFTNEVVRSLVEEMEGIVEHEGHVFVVAATNRIERVDDSVISRLGKTIEVSLPDAAGRAAILSTRLHDIKLDFVAEEGAAKIGEITEGFSGRDIVTLVGNVQQRAVMRLLQHETDEIVLKFSDFVEEVGSVARIGG
jgi:transitional endoplasmic reticulum ATPase